MVRIKTVSATYDRKQNLGDFSSANIGMTIWADVDEDDDLDRVMHDLWAMAKANVKAQLKPIVQPKAEVVETFLGLPVKDEGVTNADSH